MSVSEETIRKYVEECRVEVDEQIIDNRRHIEALHHSVDELQDSVDKLSNNVSELLAIFRAFDGFLTVGSWFGKFVRWLVGVGIAVAAVIAYLKGFKP